MLRQREHHACRSPQVASAEEQKEMQDKVTSPEKAEEAKLKTRYPHLGQKPDGSDFLRKRLQKGKKYFYSGDYNMAKTNTHIRPRANTTMGLDYEHMIKARAHKEGVRIGKTPKKLASICCP
jgi:hypothetical protein